MLWYSPVLILVLLNNDAVLSFNLSAIDEIKTIDTFSNDVRNRYRGGFPYETILNQEYSRSTQFQIIFDKMNDIIKNLTQLPGKSDPRLHIDSLLQEIRPDGMEKLLFEFRLNIKTIFAVYNVIKEFTNNPNNKDAEKMSVFFNTLTDLKREYLKPALEKLHQIVKPQQNTTAKSLLERFVENINFTNPRSHCSQHMSFDQRIFFIYAEIIRSELSGFLVIAFSNALFTILNNGREVKELNEAASQMIRRSQDYLLLTKEAMKKAPTNFELCDPSQMEPGKTYIELKGAIQEFIVNEADIAPEGSCRGTCSDRKPNSVNGCYYSNEYCPLHPCKGRMYRCQDIGNSKICELPKGSPNRYEWIISTQGRYGSVDQKCSGTVKSAYQHVTWGGICSMCICSCVDESQDSDAIRTLSLRPQLSDIKANKVVTGVRFIEKNNIIHVQIREGILLPFGHIESGSDRWVELETLHYYKGNGVFYKIDKIRQTVLEANKDYFQIKKDQRAICLDDIPVYEDYVVTGVKLSYINILTKSGGTEAGVELQVYATPYDFKSGRLTPDVSTPSHWVHSQLLTPTDAANKRHVLSREELLIMTSLPNNPHYIANTNLPDSKNHQFVKFSTSDIFQDVGQHVIPYLDSRDVVLPQSSPLHGVGIAHRGGPRSGGYITLKTFNINHSRRLHPSNKFGN